MHPDPDSQSLILQIALLIVLTIINALFSGAEMALVSTSRSRVEQRAEEGDKKYQKLLTILNQPSNFLSTIQIGITLINILSGASLADSLATRLAPVLGGTPTAKTLASVIILAILTYISIVFGELYPKRIAQNLKEKYALAAVGPLNVLGHLMHPFVWLLATSTNILSKLTPMTFDDDNENMTRDEIEYLLNTDNTALDQNEREMLAGVFSLDELMAREIMVPRTDAFMIDVNDDVHDNIMAVLAQNYSRIPVYDDDKDKILGVLHTKTLLKKGYTQGFDKLALADIIQEPLFVPETIFVDDLLRELKKTQNQMAILLNEYGGVEGIVTLEDLLEEIVGEIEDESDIAEKDIFKINENIFAVKGGLTLNDFNEYFDTHLESDDVDTIAGYFMAGIGAIPGEKEQIDYDVITEKDNLTLTSLEVDGTRLVKLRVTFHGDELEAEAASDDK
ncbi:hemolysin family protein [Lactococcus paracarnosus]|uniref:Hemolysin n=1 Tax=Pseudolactococcus paracarnosus TaxID=2749962 RepID=A0A7L4WF36_9LACT|nr:hemolysin family protein [Lactococcus paracarnosus]SPC37425.1 Magnesium and cobalt efflux protein CorC [Lactococcus piscium]MCJ1976795.1 HlyC/CorC family transporter [Lactococcus paracarnosus]MCJ1982819.1 HlyC/CorC family transporter [Lactococcus paracarnosus]MCJ1993442.1 HlyC/CorC family transporter [Lactococcus paracarnosus]MCJ1997450.1 HlyC/CorC family transporter [Lactococcus paracarnosus]